MEMWIGRLVLACWLGCAAGLAAAQGAAYPAKPVRVLVGFPPGGSIDVIAREVSAELSKSMGQQFVVENKSGANGIIASTELSKAAPDGYTLMLTISSHVTNTLLYPKSKRSYELKDFQPVSLVATSPFVLIAHPSFPPNNVKELIALAKQKGRAIDFASPGSGSTQHLAMELLMLQAGIQLTHIPYRGGAPALTDLLGGQVPMTFLTTVQSLPHLKDGKVKALAVTTAKRSPILPDVPTVAESGVPGYESDVWFGFIAPANTPKAVVDRLSEEIVRIVQSLAVRQKLSAQGAEPLGQPAAALQSLIEAERLKWADVFKRTGIQVE